MSLFPAAPPSLEQQRRHMTQLYLLLGQQVESYHRHRHMGSNTSVPVELAQELTQSIQFTLDQVGGGWNCPDLAEALRAGQAVLEVKFAQARASLKLVTDTAPEWQTDCRWDAMRDLGKYLEQYDHRHLAHRGPDLFYPPLLSPPEELMGIDLCQFYLNILWIENRIMAGIKEEALALLWNRLPEGTLNQCERLLINGIGRSLIGSTLERLTFNPEERRMLRSVPLTREALEAAADSFCRQIGLTDENTGSYVHAVIPQILLYAGMDPESGCFSALFL